MTTEEIYVGKLNPIKYDKSQPERELKNNQLSENDRCKHKIIVMLIKIYINQQLKNITGDYLSRRERFPGRNLKRSKSTFTRSVDLARRIYPAPEKCNNQKKAMPNIKIVHFASVENGKKVRQKIENDTEIDEIDQTESEDDGENNDTYKRFLLAYNNIEISKIVADKNTKQMSENFIETIYKLDGNIYQNEEIIVQPKKLTELERVEKETEKLNEKDGLESYAKFADRYAENFKIFEKLMNEVNDNDSDFSETDENLIKFKQLRNKQKFINNLVKRTKNEKK